ncbi:MAG: class I adenylate-forming enzyme family protein [Acidimicrobiales bacterium]|jgi:acyl-CoA synthetase (AMP-forming)/AMP-acid ligase II|nr:class I adenylate-forming enzyme family protein [Acidimicrobiales bacterium]MDP6299449.1 class I adenylate-forming enzyme family protein [Acidimicrobiales bacterium]HJM28807.1 class I adenylate-forming enzyme family protein [Acidimicrobiales bacterium]
MNIEAFPKTFLKSYIKHPKRDCVILVNERATYQEIYERSIQVAKSLSALGVTRGERVGILMPNSLDFVISLMGTAFIGAIPTLYNGRFKTREIAHVTSDASIKTILTSDKIEEHVNYGHLLRSAIPGLEQQSDLKNLNIPTLPELETTVMLGVTEHEGFMTEEEFFKHGMRIDKTKILNQIDYLDPSDPAVMFYTSGTTAMPKGCILSHKVLQHAGIVGGVERLGLRTGDKIWAPLPMFHTAFTQPFMGVLSIGGTLISMEHFDATEALKMIKTERPNIAFPAFTTIMMALLDHPQYDIETFSSTRTILNVAPEDVLMKMQEKMPHTSQITVFGMTETGGSVCMGETTAPLEKRTQTCGTALPGNEIQIQNPTTGEVVGPGIKGEILVRGVGVFDGYHNDEMKNTEVFDADGWFHTGDLGKLTVNNEIVFCGRLKDMLKVGGENVAAVEVEGFLCAHPKVKIAAIVGLPDDKYGEVPVAYIETLAYEDLTEEELIDYCKNQIASYKIPRHVRFIEDWPMGATKILKYELRDRIIEELQS